MFVELKVLLSQGASQSVVAGVGQTVQVGRLKRDNQLALADPLMAPVHFSLSHEAGEVRVKDLNVGAQKHRVCAAECFTHELRNSRCLTGCLLHDRSANLGLYLNGEKVQEASVKDGDVLVAGSSCFEIAINETAPELPPLPATAGRLTPSQQARLLELLASQQLPLFALVDAARAPGLLGLLRTHSEVYYSLYDGPEGEKLDEVAPYLVQLHAKSPLTQALVAAQWGNSWGCFVWALADFKTLRRHFRRFLMVEDERGKRMYFRFYDPRVLRVFLPTCTTAEAFEFFGPLKYFVMEASDPAVALMVSIRAGELLRTDSVAL